MSKDQKRKKPATKQPVHQLKPISLKEPAAKSELAKVVGGGFNLANHNESFIVLYVTVSQAGKSWRSDHEQKPEA